MRTSEFLHVIAAVGLFAVAAGCASSQSQPKITGPASQVKTELVPAQLHELVTELARQFGIELRAAGNEIENAAEERAIRRKSVSWRIVTDRYIEEATHLADPRVALIDLWALALQMRDFFAGPNGSALFGSQSARALQACENMVGEAEVVARKIVLPDSIERGKKAVVDFARAHPMGATYTRESTRAMSTTGSDAHLMGSALDTAFVPLRAIGGMDETAAAIQHATLVAAEAIQMTSLMPERLRWQIQLMLYDVEDLETVGVARDAASSLSRTSEGLAQTARELPQTLHTMLDDVDQRQPGLQATLREARAAIEAVEKTASACEGALKEYRAMSNEAAARSAAEPPAPPSEPARPFDINEYTRAAESATRTIAELNTALASVRQIAAPPAGEPAALDEVSAHVRSIAIHVGLVLAATVAVVLLLVLGYRMLARRLVRA